MRPPGPVRHHNNAVRLFLCIRRMGRYSVNTKSFPPKRLEGSYLSPALPSTETMPSPESDCRNTIATSCCIAAVAAPVRLKSSKYQEKDVWSLRARAWNASYGCMVHSNNVISKTQTRSPMRKRNTYRNFVGELCGPTSQCERRETRNILLIPNKQCTYPDPQPTAKTPSTPA